MVRSTRGNGCSLTLTVLSAKLTARDVRPQASQDKCHQEIKQRNGLQRGMFGAAGGRHIVIPAEKPCLRP